MNPDLGCFSKGIIFQVNFAASHDFSQLSHELCGRTVSLHVPHVVLSLDTTGCLSVVISHFQQRFCFQMNSLTYLVGAETQVREMGHHSHEPLRKAIEASLGFVKCVLSTAYF